MCDNNNNGENHNKRWSFMWEKKWNLNMDEKMKDNSKIMASLC